MDHWNVTCLAYSINCKHLQFLHLVYSEIHVLNANLHYSFHYSNVVDDNGDPHFEKIQTHVDKFDDEIRHIADKLVKACQNPQGGDKCERAFSIHKCWKMTDPKVSHFSNSSIFSIVSYASCVNIDMSTIIRYFRCSIISWLEMLKWTNWHLNSISSGVFYGNWFFMG